ncbi:hypothetical protein DFH07DRAFT_774042 [Mycena maculata]|uniref:Uncharacterized protein n=1 Tax=Mycena maculata TaxID=230809 RepID=A0AAD7J3I1_9AGAR|nr:hypothetical protein DFH07DRAFT_774042 [Mycena maculata]
MRHSTYAGAIQALISAIAALQHGIGHIRAAAAARGSPIMRWWLGGVMTVAPELDDIDRMTATSSTSGPRNTHRTNTSPRALLRVNKRWHALGRPRLYATAAISLKGKWVARPLRRTLESNAALAALVAELLRPTTASTQHATSYSTLALISSAWMPSKESSLWRT